MNNDYLKDVLIELENIYEELKSNKDKRMIKKLIIKIREWLEKGVIRQIKLHEIKKFEAGLFDRKTGMKTIKVKNDRDYQVGDLIRFIDENTLYRIYDVLNDLEGYELDTGDCILTILDIKES